MYPEFFHSHTEIWTARTAGCALSEQRVLVVDDYIDTADAVCASMLVHGLDARVAYGGREALKIAESWLPHSIVLDIEMPEVSGLAVAIALRAMPDTEATVLVAYTAQSAEAEYCAIRDSGFDAICVKPATPANLLRLLEALGRPASGSALDEAVGHVS